MSRKWFHEKVIQRYFKEECGYYESPFDGEDIALEDARYNDSFDQFPDEYVTIGGREHPAEVEWRSSDFDHFEHSRYDEFLEEDGFIVVIERDESYEDIPQLELDTDHLEAWVVDQADALLEDTLTSVRDARGNGRHPLLEKGQASVASVRFTDQGNGNVYYRMQWRENGGVKDEHWQRIPEHDFVLYYFSRVVRSTYKAEDPDVFPLFGET